MTIRQRATGESKHASLRCTKIATPLGIWYYWPKRWYRRRQQHVHIVMGRPIIVHIPAMMPMIPATPSFEPPSPVPPFVPPPPLPLLLPAAGVVVGADAGLVLDAAGVVLEDCAAVTAVEVDPPAPYPQTDCPPSPTEMISATPNCKNPGAYSVHAVYMSWADVVRTSQPHEV
jgi:hypothetical protein